MKINKPKIRRIFQEIKKHRYTPLVLAFVAGTVIGGALVYGSSSSKNSKTNYLTVDERRELQAESRNSRLQMNYERLRARINHDQQEGRLTQKQTELLLDKVDEVYEKYQDTWDGSRESRSKLNQIRKEMHEWARENDISSRYMIDIY